MKIDLGKKTYVAPLPVLIIGTYCEDGTADAMNAAWGTVSDFNKIALYLASEHKSYANIVSRKAFTVAIGNKDNVVACDYVGLVSANDDPNKMEKSGFTTSKSEKVDAPIINELPLVLECKLDYIDEKETCIYGEVVGVLADEEILTDGKIDVFKLNPIAYESASHSYITLGEKVGKAFCDGAKLKA